MPITPLFGEDLVLTTQETLLSLTEAATSKINEIIAKDSAHGTFIRLAATQSCGCGSVGYEMSLEEKPKELDVISDISGVKFAVDKGSLENIRGIEIDYVTSLERSGFKISNPNAKSGGGGGGGCGCGGH